MTAISSGISKDEDIVIDNLIANRKHEIETILNLSNLLGKFTKNHRSIT